MSLCTPYWPVASARHARERTDGSLYADLRSLSLRQNLLTDAAPIASLRSAPVLRELILHDNQLTEVKLALLFKSAGHVEAATRTRAACLRRPAMMAVLTLVSVLFHGAVHVCCNNWC